MQALSEMPLSVEEVCAGVTTRVWEHIEDHPEYNKSNQPWTACLRSVLDRVMTVPQDVQKFMLFNFMVQANLLMDDPHTKFFGRFPDIMAQFGRLLNITLLDHTTTETCMLNVPCTQTRLAYPANYFVNNPSLEIVWYDSEAKKIRNYLLTIGFTSPTVCTIGPNQLCFDKVTVTDNLMSCTPIKKMHFMKRFAEDKVVKYEEYKEYHKELCHTIPVMDKKVKREHNEMNQLSYCEMANMIVKRQKTEISIKEFS